MAFQKQLLLVALFGARAAALAQTPTANDLFDGSVLHEVRITMLDADWQALKARYLEDIPFTVTSFQWKGGGANAATAANVAIHSRGWGSRSQIKPGLHVSFGENVKGQTFLGLTDVDLINNSQEPTQIHERLSMLLFQRMGLFSPREAPARTYVNGEYIGLFNIAEAVDEDFLMRVFHENTGYLYSYRLGDWTGVPGAGYHFEYLGPDLTKYAVTPPDNKPAPFEPKTHSGAPDSVTLEGMIGTMNQVPSHCVTPSCQASDADFISAMTPYLDLKGWLQHVAIETYLADYDCILGDAFGLNNFYLYRFVNKQLNITIAWDKDQAFDWATRPIFQNANQNVLMRRLVAIPEYKNAYLEALLKTVMFAGVTGGWLQQEAAREYAQVKDAVYQDPNKTTENNGVLVPVTNADFEAGVKTVLDFPGLRASFVIRSVTNEGYQVPSSYPALSDGGVVSAASFVASPAAGGLASIFGSNLGSGDNTTVYINGFAAPVFFASPGQFNVQVPWEAGGLAPFSMIVNGVPSNVQTATVNTYSPDVFMTSPTQAAITHADGSAVTTTSPATANETVVVYATGLGPVSGAMVTGKPASATSLQPTSPNQATAMIGGITAPVAFSGLTPGFTGLYQVNLQIPANVPPGSFLTISIGGQSSPPVPLPIQ